MVAPAPVVVKLKEYVPLGKKVVVKGIKPVPPQVTGFTTVPASMIGLGGLEIVFGIVPSEEHPKTVIAKLLYVPADNPDKVKAFAETVILAVVATLFLL